MFLAQPGKKAPFLYGMTAGRRFYSFEDQAGRPAACIVAHDCAEPNLHALIQEFVRHASAFSSRDADIVVLGNQAVVEALAGNLPAGCPILLVDCASACRTQEHVVFVTDRNLRVAMRGAPGPNAVADCLRCLDDGGVKGVLKLAR